jgi:hypothetical protein
VVSAPAATGPAYRLSPFQRRLVLAACPAGAAIAGARYVREGNFPCPVWVRTRLRGGAEHAVLLRLDRHPELVARYRERHGLSERDFALRSAVHCLTLLLGSPPGAPVHAARRGEVVAQLDADLRRLASA